MWKNFSKLESLAKLFPFLSEGKSYLLASLWRRKNYDMFLYGDRERGEVPNGMGGGGVWELHTKFLEEKEKRL
jgi:hypothetical protein